jgi:hypothetical protein
MKSINQIIREHDNKPDQQLRMAKPITPQSAAWLRCMRHVDALSPDCDAVVDYAVKSCQETHQTYTGSKTHTHYWLIDEFEGYEIRFLIRQDKETNVVYAEYVAFNNQENTVYQRVLVDKKTS